MDIHEQYMRRCIYLALKGAGTVSPNPMVGAVLVYENRIIGEGWHRAYGKAHAEVNCIGSVSEADRPLIAQSVLYVSLEPCAHYGHTPPCAELIIRHRIPGVVIGCVDTFSEVSGKGIALLQAAGIEVTTGVLEKECRYLNRRFFSRQERQRPYVFLKWAQSEDGFLAPEQGRRVMLSNHYAQQLVHRMRAGEDAILVGFRTALLDDPRLSNRSGAGRQPLRLVIDPDLQLPAQLQLFDGSQPTWIFNNIQEADQANLRHVQLHPEAAMAAQVLQQLGSLNSLIVEGGRKTLELFINAGLWDEALVIHTPQLLGSGTPAPVLQQAVPTHIYDLLDNRINHYTHEDTRRLYPEK